MSRILILDDEIEVGRQIEAILKKQGDYDFEALIDSQYLFDVLEHQAVDLILLDVNMPGKTGIEVLNELKAHPRYRHIPVIMVTGDENEQLMKRCFEIGAVDFVRKPIAITELQGRVRLCLKAHEYENNLEKMVAEKTRQLIHAAKLASIGELTASIAHELRQPLSVLSIESLILLEDLEDENYDGVQSSVERIRKAIRRTIKITERMRTFSRKNNETKTLAPINELLNNTLILLEKKLKQKNIEVCCEIPEDLQALYCDPVQIEQILTNLISNACDAFDKTEEKRITIRAFGEKERVLIQVGDTAEGIPEEVLPHIFDSFFTTKDEENGTGLGLSISKTIAENHGGDLRVESTIGKGTVFTLDLPITVGSA